MGGAAFTHDGGCAATMFTGGNILQILRNTMRGQKGIFAQARCMWSGPSENLLMLSSSDGAAAQSTACSPLADSDVQFERERESYVAHLSKETGYNWSSQSGAWWSRQNDRYDFSNTVNDVRNHPTTQAITDLMEGIGVRLPSDRPEDGLPVQAPVEAIKEAVKQLPLDRVKEALSWGKDLWQSRRGKQQGYARHEEATGDGTSKVSSGTEVKGEATASDGDNGGGSGSGVGGFFVGVSATIAVLAAAFGGFIFYQRHKERGLMNRRFLSHEASSTSGTFSPPNIVISPLQTGNTV